MSDFSSRAGLETAIARTAFWYCQMTSLHDTISAMLTQMMRGDIPLPTNEKQEELLGQLDRAASSCKALLAELTMLTGHLAKFPPDAPRTMPHTVRSDLGNT
jgi:hypothetical protein